MPYDCIFADKKMADTRVYEKKFDKDELQKKLTPMQYHCTQEKGTERSVVQIECHNYNDII